MSTTFVNGALIVAQGSEFLGAVTASGDISGSDNITITNITASGDLTISGSIFLQTTPTTGTSGTSIISQGYLLPEENVFKAFNRVSKAAGRRLKRKDLIPFFAEAMEKNWLCLASPVLSNFPAYQLNSPLTEWDLRYASISLSPFASSNSTTMSS